MSWSLCWEKSAMKMIFLWQCGLTRWPLTQTGHVLFQNFCSLSHKMQRQRWSSGRHGNKKENHRKNRGIILRSFQKENGHRKAKSAQKEPGNAWEHCLHLASNLAPPCSLSYWVRFRLRPIYLGRIAEKEKDITYLGCTPILRGRKGAGRKTGNSRKKKQRQKEMEGEIKRRKSVEQM